MQQLSLLEIDDNISTVDFETVCGMLSISRATGRNWMKSGLLRSVTAYKKAAFAVDEIESLIADIKDGSNTRLKGRRNKTQITGTYVPRNYVEDETSIRLVGRVLSDLTPQSPTTGFVNVILAEYALKLLASRGLVVPRAPATCYLDHYVQDKAFAGRYSALINDLLEGVNPIEGIMHTVRPALLHPIHYCKEDILGLLYMSLQCIGGRKLKGVYYTPASVVRDATDHLYQGLCTSRDAVVFDPCCGTGSFLLHCYTHNNNIRSLHGRDIDNISIALCRINIALLSRTDNLQLLQENIVCADSLVSAPTVQPDVCIGNPPWGLEFGSGQSRELRKLYVTAESRKIESFSVFLEMALRVLQEGGYVSFVLPESLLNVNIHQSIRRHCMSHGLIERVRYWGNVFNGVQCPAITLTIQKTPGVAGAKPITVVENDSEFRISCQRKLDCANWNLRIKDDENGILHKLEAGVRATTLRGNADFALGIVTGDNAKYVSSQKTESAETIIKGTDLFKYRYRHSSSYVVFEPLNFQQVAPTRFYRAEEKLIYRFICDSLVFSYDTEQALTLNSANILIPSFSDLSTKYILAVLNSRPAQYYTRLKYGSIKVLRSHIESIPIPIPDRECQDGLCALVDQVFSESSKSELLRLYNEIDDRIMRLFELNEREQVAIAERVDQQNLYLY